MLKVFVLACIVSILNGSNAAYISQGGAGAYSATEAYESESAQESSSSSFSEKNSGFTGGAYDVADGGAAAAGAAASAYSSQREGSSSYSRSYSRSSSNVQVNYQQQWGELYQVPIFQNICNLGSNAKSQLIAQRIVQQQQNIDYFSIFNQLYSKNRFFASYIYAATGIVHDKDEDRRKFFGIVKENPSAILRSVYLFARHPLIFKSSLANFALTKSSSEIIQAASSQRVAFTTYQDSFRSILQSKYYRSKFASIFRCGENDVFNYIQNAYNQNCAGIILLSRHILARRQIRSLNDYTSLDVRGFGAKDSVFVNKQFRHHQYYQKYQSITTTTTRSSSFSADSNAYNGASYGAAASSAESTSVQQSSVQQSSFESSSTTTIDYKQQWGGLYEVPVFQKICDLKSGVKSNVISPKVIDQPSFDYYAIFNDLYQKNRNFVDYIHLTTGIVQDKEIDRQRFFSLVKESPGHLLRSVSLFARHPYIFKTQLVNFALAKSSCELIRTCSSQRLAFTTYQDSFRNILRSRHYRRRFASIFRCQERDIFGYLQNAYNQNNAGVLLLTRHILTRRKLFDLNHYTSLDLQRFSAPNSIFANKAWTHNTYYRKYLSITKTTTTSVSVDEQSNLVAAGSEASGVAGVAASQQRTRTVTKTKTTTKTYQYQEEWPGLYSEPLFQEVCNLQSNFKSQAINQKYLQKEEYNYENIFATLYQKNPLFKRYIFAAVGIQEVDYEHSRFFSLVRENPGSYLRMVSLFARHPNIFKNDLADLIFSKSSAEILKVDSSVITRLGSGDYFNTLVTSTTYRNLFANVFKCGPSHDVILGHLRRSYQRNGCGTLMLIRHVLTRRSLFPFDDYMGINIVEFNRKKDYFGNKKFKHNSYFTKYYNSRGASRGAKHGHRHHRRG